MEDRVPEGAGRGLTSLTVVGDHRGLAWLRVGPDLESQGCRLSRLKFPLPQLKAVKVFVHPDGEELSRGREEGLFHETLKQLPVNTLERNCQSKQSPQVSLPYCGAECPESPF